MNCSVLLTNLSKDGAVILWSMALPGPPLRSKNLKTCNILLRQKRFCALRLSVHGLLVRAVRMRSADCTSLLFPATIYSYYYCSNHFHRSSSPPCMTETVPATLLLKPAATSRKAKVEIDVNATPSS